MSQPLATVVVLANEVAVFGPAYCTVHDEMRVQQYSLTYCQQANIYYKARHTDIECGVNVPSPSRLAVNCYSIRNDDRYDYKARLLSALGPASMDAWRTQHCQLLRFAPSSRPQPAALTAGK